MRLEWIDYAQAHYIDEQGEVQFLRPNMVQDGVALANTHDSFYFGTIVQKAALGRHLNNSLIPDPYHNGMITALPYWLIKVFPSLSIEQLLLWLPVYVSGLVCIPIVLIGRLYGCTVFGLGLLAWQLLLTVIITAPWLVIMIRIFLRLPPLLFLYFFLLAASRKRSIGFLVAGTISLLSGRFLWFDTTHHLFYCHRFFGLSHHSVLFKLFCSKN